MASSSKMRDEPWRHLDPHSEVTAEAALRALREKGHLSEWESRAALVTDSHLVDVTTQ